MRGKVLVGNIITFQSNIKVEVLTLQDDGSRIVKFYKDKKELDFLTLVDILNNIGHLPLPPYLKRDDEKSDNINYQTLFAKNYGAVAAPTASLHFTDEQHRRVCKNHKHAFVTLHVGSGTFKPVECETITEHPMHSEYYEISDKAKKILDSKIPVLSIGTTSTRTIEFYDKHGKLQKGEANLFLHPNNQPSRVNHLLTNFHLPKSTLLMLVASFVGVEKAQELYKIAIEEKYRFYSYGDAMLII